MHQIPKTPGGSEGDSIIEIIIMSYFIIRKTEEGKTRPN